VNAGTLRKSLSRYLFYGWLFHDASTGSQIERAGALRHNRGQAKWLPTYMRRWGFIGTVLLALELLSEHAWGIPVLSAVLSVALVCVLLFIIVTAICWAFLQADRQSQ
jgi:hypothetical protein